jgi:hypothetical protein
MESGVIEKLLTSDDGMKREKILVEIPQSDMVFFKFFADKLGWQFNSRQRLWEEYIKDSPEDADLTDEEIMEEVRAVRYEKVQGHR